MTATHERQLGLVSLTTLLVSAHYGLGFVLGTAEQTYAEGAIGSLYAVAVGIGAIALFLLARFYWQQIEPLWTILGNRYGQGVKIGIGLMSWSSLVGIAAVQIISVAAIVGIVGVPYRPTMVGVTLILGGLSLLPIERASWIFRGLLLFNILVLAGALWFLDHGQAYGREMIDFAPSLVHSFSSQTLGVSLSTILLVLIDMKCQQFVVRSRSLKIAGWGCVLSGLILTLLAFLPGAIVIAAQKAAILPPDITGKAIIPFVLSWLGGGTQTPLGIVFVLSIALPALGLGSNILRIQTKASFDMINPMDTWPNRILLASVNAILALAIALKGGEIVSLIVCFYAAYLSAVWIPFVAYLLEDWGAIVFSTFSVRLALMSGSGGSLTALVVTLFQPQLAWFNSPELTIMAMGFGLGSFALLAGQIGEVAWAGARSAQEDFEG